MLVATADLRSSLRGAAFATSYHLGGPRLADVVAGGRTIVLMYHGIPAREERDGIENWYGYNVPVQWLAVQLEYLARRCHVVSLTSALSGRGLSKRRTNVVLTFDDGYQNNFTNAFPLIRRLGLPATFALATGFVRNQTPLWNDVLEYAVDRARPERGALHWAGERVEYSTEDVAGRLTLFRRLWELAVRGEQTRRDGLITTVADQLGVKVAAADVFSCPDYRPLAPEQVAEMAGCDLVEFSSHSVHHYALPHLARDARRAELRQAKADVEALTGRSCSILAIPGGLYDGATLDDAFASGYSHVLSSERGDAVPGRRVIGRNVICRGHGLHEFADLVHGPLRRMSRWRGRRLQETTA
jgi:peptidoglycan/xylan/chitin deacetylase (PgdA/CDA1 family)